MQPRFFKVIACQIMVREVCLLAAQSPHLIDLEFLSLALHEDPQRHRPELQQAIDRVPEGHYHAILLGYGLCSRLLDGIEARHTPLVVPRVHDCLAFLLGSRQRFEELRAQQPGTYFFTIGWVEGPLRRYGNQGSLLSESSELFASDLALSPTASGNLLLTPPGGGVTPQIYQRWVAKYGPEKAQRLLAVARDTLQHYRRGLWIEWPQLPHAEAERHVRALCQQQGWEFQKCTGTTDYVRRWLFGQWDPHEFLIVPPGHKIVVTYDEELLQAVPSKLSTQSIEKKL